MIVKQEQRRAMEFVVVANRGGYRPTGREINQWRLAPDPRPTRRGDLLEPETPAIPERRVRKSPAVLAGLIPNQSVAVNPLLSAAERQKPELV